MIWDVTVSDILAASYLPAMPSSAVAATVGAADRKKQKYQSIALTRTFIPLAFKTLGNTNLKGADFHNQLGRRISACTMDKRDTEALLQSFSLKIQRFNAICFNERFCFNNADLDS